jgi:HEAT repeat protein
MTRQAMIDALAEYRRPGSPVYGYHFRRLPPEITRKRNLPVLLSILEDEDLPSRVRDHAAGALGEIGDQRAVAPLIGALNQPKLRRGAATALGRMKAQKATKRLRELAPESKAARWALSQVSTPTTTHGILEDLELGQLRDIGPKISKLSPKRASALSEPLIRRLEEIVANGLLSHDHRWIVTALQYVRPPEAADVAIDALAQAIDLENCCGCIRNRLMRTLGEIRPAHAIPVLVDVVSEVASPFHKHLAAVCIGKILDEHSGQAASLLVDRRARVRAELERLERELAQTASARPDTPWDRSKGTPRWAKSQRRAIIGITRLLERCRLPSA